MPLRPQRIGGIKTSSKIPEFTFLAPVVPVLQWDLLSSGAHLAMLRQCCHNHQQEMMLVPSE